MIDLTNYSDNELSLQVMNDAYFYNERHHQEFLVALVKEEFFFTDRQLAIMLEDVEQLLEEEIEEVSV